MATQTERPTLNTTPESAGEGSPQIQVSPTGYTTANSEHNGPGFYPNALGNRKFVFRRTQEETEKMKRVGRPVDTDGWTAEKEIPGAGATGLLVTKTLNGSDQYGVEVTIPESKGGFLYFDGFQVEIRGMNDVFAFYTKGQIMSRRSRKQRGGFYPSVYGGISGAKMLTPLIARQMMRMYETNTRKTRKRKSKKLSRNKRA